MHEITTKNCTTCGHRVGTVAFGQCVKTGFYISTQRKFPTGGCDRDFDGWVPRRPWWQRVLFHLGIYKE